MNRTEGSKKMFMLALIGVFVLPVVLAKIALDYNWFDRGSTNKGELIQPVLNLAPVLNAQPPKWRLVYTVPAQCDAACENAIYSIHQVWLALGKESDRAEATVFLTEKSDRAMVSTLLTNNNIHTLQASEQQIHETLNNEFKNKIFLVDTLNNAMLRYEVHNNKQQAVMASRDILADVKKLLKLSRIG
ncbi:hypothetical protein CA267_008725 [Alteromonas pelagimontana]|uniref:Uncharacterized protein n=1 Tax=Alteromonas pelagimontana TaxID=1858656 RepID=A0A6M4MCV0_9ALTE|nr:hypothetical protein [Alteromonas pelagimontana]QJR80857.1 hypothetical protein CA267_008725 [Alteromonas pelagimontana]